MQRLYQARRRRCNEHGDVYILIDMYDMVLRYTVVPRIALRAKKLVNTRQNVFSSERLSLWERLYVEFWLVEKRFR